MSIVLSEKTVKVYTPPTCSRGYRTKYAACLRWAKDLIARKGLVMRTFEQCMQCGHEPPSCSCGARRYEKFKVLDSERYRKLKKRLARWLFWRVSRASRD